MTERRKVSYVCTECGSDDVRIDAFAMWDVDKQAWVLSHMFDQAFCEQCDGETTTEERAYEENPDAGT